MPRFESASLVAIQVKFRLGLWLVPVYWCLFVINFFLCFPDTQKTACLKVEHKPPLLHVPIYFKSVDGTLMSGSSWSTVSLNLQDIIHQFAAVNSAQRSLAEQSGEADDSERIPTKRHRRPLFNERADDGATITQPLPSGAFGKVLYIKVYANCRLRRIWFSNGAPNDRHPWEFDLYGTS